MATRSEMIQEINSQPNGYRIVIKQKIERVVQITKRALVVYAVDFTSSFQLKAQAAGNLMLISLADKDGFDEITRSLIGPQTRLDILLHSPGGLAEATESIVEVLRERFSDIRFIIPSTVKSAATMLAMSGNQILMDEVSELGPTDPQMGVVRDNRAVYAPAQAIKDQFEMALEQISKDPTKTPAWLPILRDYGPSLLAECDNRIKLSRDLVSKWLQAYMFAGEQDAAEKAEEIANYLSNHNNFGSHDRRVGIDELDNKGVKIVDLRDSDKRDLHEAVRDLYSAISVAFESSSLCKLFANSKGDAFESHVVLNQALAASPPPGKIVEQATDQSQPPGSQPQPSPTPTQRPVNQNAPQKPKAAPHSGPAQQGQRKRGNRK